MSRFLLILVTIFTLSLIQPSQSLSFDPIEIESAGLDMKLGYRSDQFDWSISGDIDGENPNILSELSWDDIEIFQIQAAGWLEFGELPYLKRNARGLVNISLGKILGGDVQDSDYSANNRNDEWSRSVNDSDKGLTIDLSGAVGPIFEWSQWRVTLTPLLGYGFNMQDLSMTNGQQVISEPLLRPGRAAPPPEIGSLPGLDSNYTAYWYGPWLGLNTDYQVNENFKVTVGVEYHWIEYFAQADWNLRSDFVHPVSFEHESTGTGFVWDIQGQYTLNEKWSLLFSGNIQHWETESGTDRTFFADGTKGLSRLNHVNWESYALMTGVQYRF